MYIYTHINTYVQIYVYVCMCVCLHIYIYITGNEAPALNAFNANTVTAITTMS